MCYIPYYIIIYHSMSQYIVYILWYHILCYHRSHHITSRRQLAAVPVRSRRPRRRHTSCCCFRAVVLYVLYVYMNNYIAVCSYVLQARVKKIELEQLECIKLSSTWVSNRIIPHAEEFA